MTDKVRVKVRRRIPIISGGCAGPVEDTTVEFLNIDTLMATSLIGLLNTRPDAPKLIAAIEKQLTARWWFCCDCRASWAWPS